MPRSNSLNYHLGLMSPLRRSATAAFIVAALIASSCAGGSPSTDTDPSSGTDTGSEVDEPTDPASAQSAEGDALINGVLASCDPDDRDALVSEAAALDRTIALEMAEWSGLEEALGGPEATSAAFASHDQFYATLTNTVATPPTLGFRRSQANGPSIGEGFFGGFMLVGLGSKAIVQASNDGTTGTATPAKGFTITATDDSVEMAVDVTHEANGLTTKLKTNVKILPCPDVNGEFTVEATVDVSASAGGKEQSGKLDVKVTGQLNDNAELASSSSDFRLKRDGLDMGSFVDSSVSFASDGTSSVKLRDFNWFVGDVQTNFATNTTLASLFGLLIQQFVLDAAKEGYMSGRCVEIGYGVSPGTTGLEPGSSATITARPRGKQDGVPTGGTVQALLSAGEKSVDPSSTPIPVDAEFEYGAPDEPNKTGTVSLEARSKRGIGRVDIKFDTMQTAYAASGGGAEISVTGLIGDLGLPFVLQGEFPGGTVTFSYVPADDRSGTYSGSLSGSGVTGSVSGTYTIAGDADGPLTLMQEGGGCVDGIPNSCRDTTEVITLTPTE